MIKTEKGINKPGRDTICDRCANTFRQCPMIMVMALTRVPAGMEVQVISCPEYREPEEEDQEAYRRGKSIGGLIR